jgi:hypothetical protein
MKNSILIILLFGALAYAELPLTIPDSKIRQVVEYIDAKVNKVYGLFTPMPASGYALCINSSGKVGHCTSAVGAGGACTCE